MNCKCALACDNTSNYYLTELLQSGGKKKIIICKIPKSLHTFVQNAYIVYIICIAKPNPGLGLVIIIYDWE